MVLILTLFQHENVTNTRVNRQKLALLPQLFDRIVWMVTAIIAMLCESNTVFFLRVHEYSYLTIFTQRSMTDFYFVPLHKVKIRQTSVGKKVGIW